jgi:hypothetical protein
MHEGSKHLNKVLSDLVEAGSINQSQSTRIIERFEALNESDSKRSVIAEISAYLGGAFVIFALAVLASQRWEEISSIAKFGILATLSLILLLIALWLDGRTAMLMRLTSVLAMGSAISATAGVAVAYQLNEAPWIAFLSGCVIAVFALYKYRSEILQIGAYGYLFFTGFMIIGKFLGTEPDQSPIYPLYWVALASIWIYLSHNRVVDTTLGYLMSVATIFIATQFLFGTTSHIYSYIVSVVSSALFVLIFLRDHRWPLLVGAVALTTVTVGEFVASTLGGSLGALLGLLTAGIALITTSLIAVRKLR